MSEDVTFLESRDLSTIEVKIRPAYSRSRHLDDDIVGFGDIWDVSVDETDVFAAKPGEGFHLGPCGSGMLERDKKSVKTLTTREGEKGMYYALCAPGSCVHCDC
jgi:hypothetical protein